MQCPLEELDRPRVVPLPDRPLCVTQGDLGLVRVESLALQTPVEDLRVRDAGRRLPVGVADELELALDADAGCVRPFDEPFAEHAAGALEVGLRAVRQDALASPVRDLSLRRVKSSRRIEVDAPEANGV